MQYLTIIEVKVKDLFFLLLGIPRATQPVTRSRNRRNSNTRTISDIKLGMKKRLKTLGRKIKKSNDYIANIHGSRVMYYDY